MNRDMFCMFCPFHCQYRDYGGKCQGQQKKFIFYVIGNKIEKIFFNLVSLLTASFIYNMIVSGRKNRKTMTEKVVPPAMDVSEESMAKAKIAVSRR